MTPDRDAIWFEGATTSHGAFALRVRQAAAALAACGVRAGERVAWFSANHPSALETLYACGQLGAIWVPLNARLTAPEARYILEHSGACVVVHGGAQSPQAAALAAPAAGGQVLDRHRAARGRCRARIPALRGPGRRPPIRCTGTSRSASLTHA